MEFSKGKKIKKAVIKLTTDTITKIRTNGGNNTIKVGVLNKPFNNMNYEELNKDGNITWLAESEAINWIEKWYTCSTIDITDLVENIVENNIANYGLVFKWEYEDIINPIMMKGNNVRPRIFIQYSDEENINEEVNIRNKTETGIIEIKENFKNNKYDWLNTPIYESLLTLYKEYGDEEALNTLIRFFDYYIDENGNNSSLRTIYQADLSRVLIELYDITKEEKYLNTIHNTIKVYDEMNNGIYLVYGGEITELSYFGLPFLVEYAEYFNDNKYVDLAVNQGINLYMNMIKDQKDRVMNTVVGYKNSKGWSRGVGWYYTGLAKLLTYDSIKNHENYNLLLNIYKELSYEIIKYQLDSGLWSSIIQDSENYFEETSGTALFITGFDIGIKEGLLPLKFQESINKATRGLSKYMITGAEVNNVFQFNIKNNHLVNKDINYSDIGFGLVMEAFLKSPSKNN